MAIKSATSRCAGARKRSRGWQLELYVMTWEPRSAAAMANLRQLCDQRLAGTYKIQIVDLAKSPRRCLEDQILAIPTVVRRFPLPEKRVIGTLSNAEAAAAALEMTALCSNRANGTELPEKEKRWLSN